MLDPVLASLALGVAGNIATNITLSGAETLRETPLGKIFTRTGALRKSAAQNVTECISSAILSTINSDPAYDVPGVHEFLRDSTTQKLISDVLTGRDDAAPDILKSRLITYIERPASGAAYSFQGVNSVDTFIATLFRQIAFELSETAEPSTLWVAQKISENIKEVRKIREEMSALAIRMNYENPVTNVKSGKIRHAEFEAQYLKHVKTRFGKLTTPGARDLHGINQSLSIAYISLNIQSKDSASSRAESFLVEHPHLVIRGPAGSGKTTLLSWITTRCSSNTSDGTWINAIPFIIQLRTVARTESGPPVVENFVRYSTDPSLWATETPAGWQSSVLSAGRAIVMIDGVDELPAARRPGFWKWLAGFVEEYPGNRVVITSRTLPGTVGARGMQRTESWSPPPTFTDAHLQEMSDEDISQFIQHWHDAVDQARLDADDVLSLRKAKAVLPEKLLDPANRRIRELCSTPLLCAMVCVLHWREEGYLPRQRVDLYDKCCEMLIEARDLKREIAPPSGALGHMTANDKAMILQRLAFDMMNNKPDGDTDDTSARIEISREKALQWITPRIASFQIMEARSAPAEAVLDFLIERTGLLREPATDLIDFPHRTFQEYLAACAAGAESQDVYLAKLADDDQWHETIMLAAGTSTGGVGFGRNLIAALLSRAERHTSSRPRSLKIRKTCFALALGCLENLRQQDPTLRERVLANLAELVPPRSDVDARILSVAGDAAVPYLGYDDRKDESVTTVSSCAHALRLINTASAISLLRTGYAKDNRELVLVEVCRTGQVAYSEIPTILAAVSATGRLPHYAALQDAVHLEGVNGLTEFTLTNPMPKNIETIDRQTNLKAILVDSLDLDAAASVPWPTTVNRVHLNGVLGTDLSWLRRLSVERLSIANAGSITNLEEVSTLDGLRDLTVFMGRMIDFSPLGRLKNLECIELSRTPGLAELDWIAQCANLKEVHLDSSGDSLSASPIADLPKLEKLGLARFRAKKLPNFALIEHLEDLTIRESDLADVSAFAGLKNLRSLALRDLGSCRELNSLTELPKLQDLTISGMPRLKSLPDFRGLSKLRSLHIARCGALAHVPMELPPKLEKLNLQSLGLHEIPRLDGLNSLKSLNLSNIGNVKTTPSLAGSPNIESISLSGFEYNIDLSILESLKSLRRIFLSFCRQVSNFEEISNIESLQEIAIFNCPSIVDLSPLLGNKSLERIYLLGSHAVEFTIPDFLLDKVEYGLPHYVWAEEVGWGLRTSHRLSSRYFQHKVAQNYYYETR